MTGGIYHFDFDRDGEWLRSRIPYIRTEDACGMIAVGKDFKPLGAAIFDNFLFSSAQMALVIDSPRAIKMGLLPCAANFIFNTCNKKYCYSMVSANNVKALRLNRRVGFKQQLIIPEGAAEGVDLIVFRLDRDALTLQRRMKPNRRINAAA